MLIRKLKGLFNAEDLAGTGSGGSDNLQPAIAALLVHACHADGSVDPVELQTCTKLLRQKFALPDEEITELIAEAEAAEAEAVDLYRFTSTIKEAYDRDARGHVMEMLWELVLADGVIDDQEAHLVWRVSGLLGFTTRENGDFRRTVQDRQNGAA
jgi:uncharacterized tellurite resistance protein B-like protein